jgi:hypothetical protein
VQLDHGVSCVTSIISAGSCIDTFCTLPYRQLREVSLKDLQPATGSAEKPKNDARGRRILRAWSHQPAGARKDQTRQH